MSSRRNQRRPPEINDDEYVRELFKSLPQILPAIFVTNEYGALAVPFDCLMEFADMVGGCEACLGRKTVSTTRAPCGHVHRLCYPCSFTLNKGRQRWVFRCPIANADKEIPLFSSYKDNLHNVEYGERLMLCLGKQSVLPALSDMHVEHRYHLVLNASTDDAPSGGGNPTYFSSMASLVSLTIVVPYFHLQQWTALKLLRRIEIVSSHDVSLLGLQQLSHLEKLSLESRREATVNDVSSLTSHPSLHTLRFSNVSFLSVHELRDTLSTVKKLRALRFEEMKQSIPLAVSTLLNLTSLVLNTCALDSTVFHQYALHGLNIRELNITNCISLVELSGTMPSLTTLALAGEVISNASLQAFKAPQLKQLTLNQTSVSHLEGFGNSFPTLKTLRIENSKTSKAFASLKGCQELVELVEADFSSCSSLTAIDSIAGHPQLQRINLTGTNVFEKACTPLATLPCLTEFICNDKVARAMCCKQRWSEDCRKGSKCSFSHQEYMQRCSCGVKHLPPPGTNHKIFLSDM
eukprot:PhF_6_TR34978/c0_g1_i4/m.50808